jgi:hypothetical protein
MSCSAIASLARNLLLPSLKRPRISVTANVVGSLIDNRRDDLGYKNAQLAPASKFDDFELDVWVAKQSCEALQYYLVRGIKP